MADRDAVPAYQDFVYQEAHDPLALRFRQSVGSGAQPHAELGESFHQA
jgi:hypothetical protein